MLLPNLHCFGGCLIRHLSRPASSTERAAVCALRTYYYYCFILFSNMYIQCMYLLHLYMYISKFIFPARMCAFLPLAPFFCVPSIYIIYVILLLYYLVTTHHYILQVHTSFVVLYFRLRIEKSNPYTYIIYLTRLHII